MIKSIEFRYNRYESTLSLILLVGLFWLVGFALCLGLANVLGLQNDTEAINPPELSLFWQRHAGLALAFTVILYTSVMIFSVYSAIGLWRFLMDAKGKVEIIGNLIRKHMAKDLDKWKNDEETESKAKIGIYEQEV